MTANRAVRVSIGLPVYNGERYIRYALDSLVQQTYRDFEVIISDNASTDGTRQICQEYVARYPNIRYYRNAQNIGAAENFNRLFALASGEYFKWAAADDVIAPTFIEQCVKVLDADPAVVLCYSRVHRINSAGEVDGVYDYAMRVCDPAPHIRFSDLILVNHFCIAIFGVLRRSVLAQTPLIAKYVGSDRVLLAELGLRGKMVELPEYLFHRRDHPQTSGRQFKIYKRLSWFDPTRRASINLVNWNVGLKYLGTVKRVNLPWPEKVACYRAALRWFVHRRRVLIEDIKMAIVQILPFTKNIVHLARRISRRDMNAGGGI